jgi:hypothetical protein
MRCYGNVLHSNEHLQISTVADRLSMFTMCGRIPFGLKHFPSSIPASTSQWTTPNFLSASTSSHIRWRLSALRESAPATGAVAPTPEAVTITPRIAPPSPECATPPEGHRPGTTLQQLSAGTTAASDTELRIVHSPAPTTNRETKAADVNGGTRLHYENLPPLHYVGVTNVGAFLYFLSVVRMVFLLKLF